MKKAYYKLILLIFVAAIGTTTVAQNYNFPSRELVESILNDIDYCKNELKEAESNVAEMQGNPESYSLADYMNTKILIKRIKTCINVKRGQLDELRKEYPGWFNSPSAFSDIRIRWGGGPDPKAVNRLLDDMARRISEVLNDFDTIEKPTN
ncbi:MAG: hypothetical protein HKN48_12470 [Flavobacteriaceae bacterium]|nr:hypothetical protein [Flavobacteriaceae bacterium]